MTQPVIFSRFNQPVHFSRFKPDNLLLSTARLSGYNLAINSENRDGGKPLRDLTGLTPFFLQKIFFTQKNGLIWSDVSVYRIPD